MGITIEELEDIKAEINTIRNGLEDALDALNKIEEVLEDGNYGE